MVLLVRFPCKEQVHSAWKGVFRTTGPGPEQTDRLEGSVQAGMNLMFGARRGAVKVLFALLRRKLRAPKSSTGTPLGSHLQFPNPSIDSIRELPQLRILLNLDQVCREDSGLEAAGSFVALALAKWFSIPLASSQRS